MADKHPSMSQDERDARHWDAVSEASELLVERDFEAALVELKRVLDVDANNPYAYQLLGSTLWELRRLEPARDAFRAAVLLAPSFLGARTSLAQTLRRLGDLVGAEAEARTALRQAPEDGEAHLVVGMVHAARGERREAKHHLEAFLSSKPELEAQMEARSVLEMLELGQEGDPLDVEDDE